MAENKKLSDDSLNLVSGGSVYETAQDSRILNTLLKGVPGQCKQYEVGDLRMKDNIAEIKAAWAKVGVDATLECGYFARSGAENVYKINGNTVTRDAAIKHAMLVVGKSIPVDDDSWTIV